MSKSLVKNSFFNVVYQLLNVLFPLVTAPYVARVLLPENVGKVAVAQNWAQYFIVFAALGIPTYAVRETAQHRKNKGDLNKAFTELLVINTISTTISIIAYIMMLFTFGTFRENIALYLAVGAGILFNYITIDWLYQGIEDYGYIAVRSFIVKLLSLIALLVLVRNRNDAGILFNYITIDWLYQGIEDYGYIAVRSFIVKLLSLIALLVLVRNRNDFVIYALISTCAVGANNILNVLHLPKIGVHMTFRNLTFKHHVKPIMIFFANSISVKLYTLINVTLLGILATDDAVAFYSNSDKIIRIIITVIAGIGGVLLPRLSVYAKQGEKDHCSRIVTQVFNILLFIFLPTGIGLMLMSKEIVLILFGQPYAPSILTMQIMSLLPRLSVYAKQGEKDHCSRIVTQVFNILLFIFLPTGIGLMLMSKEIVLILFGQPYAPSILTMQIMSLLIYTLGFNNLFGTVLLAFGKEKENLICPIAGAVTCLALNFILIPQLQQNGTAIASVISEGVVTVVAIFFAARTITLHFDGKVIAKTLVATATMAGTAIASVISEGVVTVVAIFFAARTITLHFDGKVIAKTLVATATMAAVVLCFKVFLGNLVPCLIAGVGFGALTYAVVSWLLKNPVLFQIIIINLTLKRRK